ncbi:MAG: hypothetical protein PHQ89_00800 [Bacilli bacterium]|nr:hypothetical protein [Bacilli bacterium]
MKKIDLYIDFDGVILDSISIAYKELKENGVDPKDTPNAREYFLNKIDWVRILKEAEEINDAIEAIKYLRESNLFNISILTHVATMDEAIEKINFLKPRIPRLNVILVPRQLEKVDIVYADNAILIDDYTNNLNIWASDGGISIKFSLKEHVDCPFPVINNLKDVIQLIENKIINIKND